MYTNELARIAKICFLCAYGNSAGNPSTVPMYRDSASFYESAKFTGYTQSWLSLVSTLCDAVLFTASACSIYLPFVLLPVSFFPRQSPYAYGSHRHLTPTSRNSDITSHRVFVIIYSLLIHRRHHYQLTEDITVLFITLTVLNADR